MVRDDLGVQGLIYYVNHILNGADERYHRPPHREADFYASINGKEASSLFLSASHTDDRRPTIQVDPFAI